MLQPEARDFFVVRPEDVIGFALRLAHAESMPAQCDFAYTDFRAPNSSGGAATGSLPTQPL